MSANPSVITMGADLLEFGAAGFGYIPYSEIVPNNTTGVVIKAQPGFVFGVHCFNTSATAGFVRFYNQTTAPATTDTPVLRLAVQVAANGGWSNYEFPGGYYFDTGIAIRFTAAIADNDATAPAATTYLLNVAFK